MKNQEEVMIIVCSNAVPGMALKQASEWVCDKCNSQIYVSNSSIESAKEQGFEVPQIRTICVICAMLFAKIKDHILKEHIEVVPLTKKQQQEVKSRMH